MRCLFVITSMPVGGAETLLVNLMRRMDTQRVTCELACLKEPGPLGEQVRDEFPVHANLIRGKYDFRVISRLSRLMRDRKLDAVITVGAGDKMFWGRIAAAMAGVPLIASALHSTGWPDGVGRMNRMLECITDAYIAVADSHGKFLHEFEGFPESKIHVIRNGIDCQRFVPDAAAGPSLRRDLGVSPDAQLVGIVAALREEKNHEMLIRCAQRCRSRDDRTHWVIVGDGPQRARIESLAKELGVADRVLLLGTRGDTPQILAGLDVFTLCSLNEASPVSILESLACEVPVVATDVGSVSESVIDGRTGYLVPSQDLDAMTNAVTRLLNDREKRTCLGREGRQLVRRSGSLDSMVAGYTELIESCDDRVTFPLPDEAMLGASASAGAGLPQA